MAVKINVPHCVLSQNTMCLNYSTTH